MTTKTTDPEASETVQKKHTERESASETPAKDAKKQRKKLRLPTFGRQETLKLIRGVLLFTVSFLFMRCETLFSAFPLGIALLAAAESGVSFIYFGAVAAALPLFDAVFDPISILVCSAVVLLRVGVRMTVDLPWQANDPEIRTFGQFSGSLFHEHIALRMMSGCIGAFLLGLYRMIRGGYQFYDLFASLFLMISVPLAVFLLSGVWERHPFMLRSFRTLSSVSVLIAMLVLSLREITLYRVSLSVALALIATLWLTSRKGISVGILTGLLFGIAFDPIAAPLFAFAALGFGSLRRFSLFVSSLTAMGIGMAWSLYVYGLPALSSVFPALILGAMLFTVLDHLGALPGKAITSANAHADESDPVALHAGEDHAEETEVDPEEERITILRTAMEAERLRAEEKKIDDLCTAFQAVSDLLSTLSEEQKYPPEGDLRRICDRVCDEFCPGCASCNLCWGSEYAEMAALLCRMAEVLHKNGSIDREILPKKVAERCKMSGALLHRINEEAALLTRTTVKQRGIGTLSADYAAAARLFRSASQSTDGAFRLNDLRSRAAMKLLEENQIYPSRVAVAEGTRGCLYAWNVEREAVEAYLKEISKGKLQISAGKSQPKRDIFINTVGFCPDDPIFTPITGCDGLFDLRINAAPRFTVTHTSLRKPMVGDKETVCSPCGDAVSVFHSNDGRSFALLSDGMGSGEDAARRSGICSIFLQKMLESGGETSAILHMLNDFLRAGASSETSATVDLFELDLFTGEGRFWKSGAAPSFVFRDGNVFRLSSRTVPAGILKEPDVQKTVFRLYHGDIVVLLSDGIADSITERGEDCLYLESMLCGIVDRQPIGGDSANGDDTSLKEAARRIIEDLPENGNVSDDRSVILLRIGEKNALSTLPDIRSAG